MKISFVVTGKTDASYLTEGIEVYVRRITRYLPFELVILPELKNTRGLSPEEVRQREGQVLLRTLASTDYLLLLDDKGKQFSSIAFADYLQGQMNRNIKHLKFVCGGAFGFSPEVYERANDQISLSKLTFSHQLVRLIFVEQLYRAFAILNNEPYHHE